MKDQFDSQRLREVRITLGLSQQKMAKNLRLKQGSLSDIERGKTKGLSESVSILLEQIYNVNLAYFYHNSDQMFLQANTVDSNRKSALSKFSTNQIVKYLIDNEKSFRANMLFRSYLNVIISDYEAKAATATYARLKEMEKQKDKVRQDQHTEKDA